MSSFAFFLFSVQLCLVQNVYSQCLRGAALPPATLGYGVGLAPSQAYGLGAEFASSTSGCLASAAYGGAGVGNLRVAGELPVAGTTLVTGQIPVLGSVYFDGALPATGSVSIAGSCGCGCNPY